MEFWVIDEAEDFIVLNCCSYVYYREDTQPPWSLGVAEDEDEVV